ncbi:DUF4124 domain-containing protein [Marilutibacter alkalisoli]|nr:DUF4124 domain-containing protein [Lysobacter alkalisoli]
MTRPTSSRPAGRALLAMALPAVAMLLVALPAAAQVYQWKDANGVTHYSDSPPPDHDYRNRNVKTSQGMAVETAGEDAPAENAQCTQARGNLALLSGDAPVGVDTDGDGKPDDTLDADQRAAQKKLAEAAIGVHCTTAAAADD